MENPELVLAASLKSGHRLWIMCQYCSRAFLDPERLLDHQVESHRKLYCRDNDLQLNTRTRRAYARKVKHEMVEEDKSVQDDKSEATTEELMTSPTTQGDDDCVIYAESNKLLDPVLEKFGSDLEFTGKDINGNDTGDLASDPEDLIVVDENVKPATVHSAMEVECHPDYEETSQKFKSALDRAIMSPTSAANGFRCRFCTSAHFPTKCGLKLHELVFHNARTKPKFTCRFCQKVSFKESLHLVHEKSCFVSEQPPVIKGHC